MAEEADVVDESEMTEKLANENCSRYTNTGKVSFVKLIQNC